MNRKNKNIRYLFIFILMATSLSGCFIYHKPEFRGRVLDAETKEPLEGAVVVATYNKESMGLGAGSVTRIINVRETLTDKEGIFRIPSYTSVINIFSRSDFATFIIFKPGYGAYPSHQQVPAGVNRRDAEIYFSEDFGKEREIELWRGSVQEGNGPQRYKFRLPFGIVELPKLTTVEQRRLNIPSLPSELDFLDEQKNLIRLINEEEKNLGLQRSDPYKAREFILNKGR